MRNDAVSSIPPLSPICRSGQYRRLQNADRRDSVCSDRCAAALEAPPAGPALVSVLHMPYRQTVMANEYTRGKERQTVSRQHEFFAGSVRYVEDLLARELLDFGAQNIRQTRAGVYFSGTLETAYRACLWSRVASRILLPLKTFPAAAPAQLYEGAAQIRWTDHLSADGTLAVDCSLSQSAIRHSVYAAQIVKDAVVDCLRARGGRRPSVSLQRPDVRLNLHLHQDRAVISVDLSGESLHRRTYRKRSGEAPLKENIAAAVLLRARWPEIAESGGGFVDPLCGAGTLPIEAALLAADCPPGLSRSYFGFLGWKQHQADAWQRLLAEAEQRRQEGLRNRLGPIVGYDADGRAIKAAWQHAQRAGLDKIVHFEKRTLREFIAPTGMKSGLLVANPPYGERLGNESELPGLYNLLGQKLAEQCRGWKAAVITSNPQLGRSIGLRAGKINTLYNGALKCQLLQFDLDEGNRWQSLAAGAGKAVKKEEVFRQESCLISASLGRESKLVQYEMDLLQIKRVF